jgi:protein-tyrosine phosphatase
METEVPMNQIHPYPLWLGHAGESRDYQKVFDLGVKVLIQLAAEEPSLQPPRELVYCRFPLLDGPGNRAELLFLAVSTVATLIKMHVPTLVACGAGMSRSPAVAAAALSMSFHEPPEKYLEKVLQHHPGDVSPGFWNEITSLLPTVR